MYVCICRAVTELEIKASIETGANTVAAVTRACCAGDDCGACHGAIEELLEESRECAGMQPVVALRVRERAA
jgi:bacterioferritin-associated ferredoxin